MNAKSPSVSESPSVVAPPRTSQRHLVALGILGLLSMLFAWQQNLGILVGGEISLPKILWLNFAVGVFYVIPFCLWRNHSLDPNLRRLFGWVCASFAARGVVEFPLLYFAEAWKCGYGIAHDGFTFLLVMGLRLRQAAAISVADRRAFFFATLLQTTLLVESAMAWAFSRLASPAHGVYFASDAEAFRAINQATWLAVGVLYPMLAGFLWMARDDFRAYENKTTAE